MIEWGKLDKQLIHTAYHRFSQATKHTQNRIEQKTTILKEAFAIKDYLSGLSELHIYHELLACVTPIDTSWLPIKEPTEIIIS